MQATSTRPEMPVIPLLRVDVTARLAPSAAPCGLVNDSHDNDTVIVSGQVGYAF
jgi:hypothetical protein